MGNDGIFTTSVELYLARTARLSSPPHPVLLEMLDHGTSLAFPIIGPEVGRFFFQLAQIKQPTCVLELGSGFGYSAMWWALGFRKARIHLTEYRQENLDRAMDYAKAASVDDQIVCHRGDALRIAETFEEQADIVFCDIDKEDYAEAAAFAKDHLKPGGLLLFDNILWKGKVALDEEDWDRPTEMIVETTRALYHDSAWATSILPIRDGVLMAVRQ